jgi:hypothetical protein
VQKEIDAAQKKYDFAVSERSNISHQQDSKPGKRKVNYWQIPPL